jgi:hypothetical protein
MKATACQGYQLHCGEDAGSRERHSSVGMRLLLRASSSLEAAVHIH